MTTPIISNPSTTIRRYSLFAEAYQREQDARREWLSAGFLNEVENTTASAVRLIQAAEKLKKAVQDRKSVVRDVFDGPNSILTTRRAEIDNALRDPFIDKERACALLEELAEIETALSRE